MATVIADFFKYNLWANLRLLDATIKGIFGRESRVRRGRGEFDDDLHLVEFYLIFGLKRS